MVTVHVSADSTAIEVPINHVSALKMWSWLTRWLLDKPGLRFAVASGLGKILSTHPTGWRESFLTAVTDGAAEVTFLKRVASSAGVQPLEVPTVKEPEVEVKPFEKDTPAKQLVDYAQEWAHQNKGGMSGPLVVELAYVFLNVPKEVLEPYLPRPVDPDAELVERIARIKYKKWLLDWDRAALEAAARLAVNAREYLELVRTAQQELKAEGK